MRLSPLVGWLSATASAHRALGRYGLEDFKAAYCMPTYGEIPLPSGSRLQKLIVLFRHADRAPLDMDGTDGAWDSEECVMCDEKECRKSKCEPGAITAIGYGEARQLGTHIQKTYMQSMQPGSTTVHGTHTPSERTKTSLMGVLDAMGRGRQKVYEDAQLVSGEECMSLRDALVTPRSGRYVYKMFDRAMTSLCHAKEIPCKGDQPCTERSALRMLRREHRDYETVMKELRDDLALNVLGFHDLAPKLLDALSRPERIVLISAHDSTVSKALNGLNIDYNGIPPYASAIFIEVFGGVGSEHVRVVYQGVAHSIGLEQKQLTPKEEFVKYLRQFADAKDDVLGVCQLHAGRRGESAAATKKEILKKVRDEEFVARYGASHGAARGALQQKRQASAVAPAAAGTGGGRLASVLRAIGGYFELKPPQSLLATTVVKVLERKPSKSLLAPAEWLASKSSKSKKSSRKKSKKGSSSEGSSDEDECTKGRQERCMESQRKRECTCCEQKRASNCDCRKKLEAKREQEERVAVNSCEPKCQKTCG